MDASAAPQTLVRGAVEPEVVAEFEDRPSFDVARLMASWLSGLADTTRQTYIASLAKFAEFIGVSEWPECVQGLLTASPGEAYELSQRYRAWLECPGIAGTRNGYAPATVARHLSTLASLTREARRLGWIAWSLDPRRPKVTPYRDTRGPGMEAIRAMFAAVNGKTPLDIRDRAILCLLVLLALRRNEVAGLNLKHIDLSRQVVWVERKRHAERVMMELPDVVATSIEAWLDVRGRAAGPLFWPAPRGEFQRGRRLTGHGVWRVVKRIARAADLDGVWPHGLRHSAITEAIRRARENGYGLEEVLDLSGHAGVQVLMLYRDKERDVQGDLSSLLAASALSAASILPVDE